MNVKITPDFWSDPDLEDASPETRLAILWLLTNPRVNLVGYAEIGMKRFIFETGLTPEALAKAFEALPKGFQREGSAYWIRGFIRHQFGRGSALVRNNYCKPLLRDMKGLCSPWVIAAILKEYPELREAWEEAGLEEGSPSETKHQLSSDRIREAKIGSEGDGRKPADLAAVIAYFEAHEAPAAEAEKFFNHYKGNGWKQGGRAAIQSWHSVANTWIQRWRDGEDPSGKNPSGGGPRGGAGGDANPSAHIPLLVPEGDGGRTVKPRA